MHGKTHTEYISRAGIAALTESATNAVKALGAIDAKTQSKLKLAMRRDLSRFMSQYRLAMQQDGTERIKRLRTISESFETLYSSKGSLFKRVLAAQKQSAEQGDKK
ncbi:MAG: hypothetical protein AAF394_01350 [Planctomycetota bacterium]